MTHLIGLIGYFAGNTYCGSARNDKDSYMHPMSKHIKNPTLLKKVCKECLKFKLEMLELAIEEITEEYGEADQYEKEELLEEVNDFKKQKSNVEQAIANE